MAKEKKLEWLTEKRKVNDLLPLDINPRKISEAKKQQLTVKFRNNLKQK